MLRIPLELVIPYLALEIFPCTSLGPSSHTEQTEAKAISREFQGIYSGENSFWDVGLYELTR